MFSLIVVSLNRVFSDPHFSHARSTSGDGFNQTDRNLRRAGYKVFKMIFRPGFRDL